MCCAPAPTPALVLAPLVLVGGGGFVAGARAAPRPERRSSSRCRSSGSRPPQRAAAHLLGAAKRDYRLAPSWVGAISHPLVIAVAVPLRRLLRRNRPASRRGDCWTRPGRARRRAAAGANPMLLLALLLLLRCMLDTWDNVYYPLPLVIALLVWETCSLGRAPVLALIGTALVWLITWPSLDLSVDLRAALFLAWSVPLAISLGATLYLPGARRDAIAAARRRHASSTGRSRSRGRPGDRQRKWAGTPHERRLLSCSRSPARAVTGCLGLRADVPGGDYQHEVRPSFEALAHGHLGASCACYPHTGGR